LLITCARCGQERLFNEAHSAQHYMLLRDILDRMRHVGYGGMVGKAELLAGLEGASSRPGRRIALKNG
jgi:hypothetical protein